MKITPISDTHLECGPLSLPGGEVLILAGDICEYRTLRQEWQETAGASYDFFYTECAKYEQVFMVLGNHEHYHNRFDRTYQDFTAVLPKNVTLLEDQMVEYKGVVFLGATLWTDLNRGDPVTAWHLKSAMNDYRVVQNHYKDKNLYYKLTPEHTREVHLKTLQYFKLMLAEHRDKPVVVVTHHAPSFASVHERYRSDTTMNGGYASNLDDFILDNENIKVWVHGHMHDPVDYLVGTTRVVSNPRGYTPYEDGNGFNLDFTFEV